MSEGKTSDKNIVLYLSLWFNAFKELNAGISKDDLAKRLAELEERIKILTSENEGSLFSHLLQPFLSFFSPFT